MPNYYCLQCGSPNSTNGIKPKFCQSCGEPFEKTASAVKSSFINNVLIVHPQKEEDIIIPRIDKLEYTIQYDRRPAKPLTVADLRGEPIDTGRVGLINLKAKRPKIDKVKFMSDAASTPRNQPIDIMGE